MFVKSLTECIICSRHIKQVCHLPNPNHTVHQHHFLLPCNTRSAAHVKTTVTLRTNACLFDCRFGDGEYLLTQGAAVSTQDKWSIEAGTSQIGTDLMTVLRVHKGQRLYLGLPSPGQEGSYLSKLLKATQATCQQVTYANLWVNANYPKTKQLWSEMIQNRSQDLVLIVGEPVAAHLSRQLPQKRFAGVMTVPVSGVAQWKGEYRRQRIHEAVRLAEHHTKKVFLVSAGPIAKVLISAMWNATQNNQYIDVGSSFDEVGKGVVTRAYMDQTSSYASQRDPCWSVSVMGVPQAAACTA